MGAGGLDHIENHKCDICYSFFRNTGTEPPQEAIGPIGPSYFLREVLVSTFVNYHI